MTDHTHAEPPRRGTIAVMAVACGVMAGNIYLCQPLLGEIAFDFGVPQHLAALVAVATQVGYALGILLLVPLSDVADPRRLLRWLFAATTIGLAGGAGAPKIQVLVLASLSLSLTTVVPQILIPLATSLAPPEQRGRVVGSLMTGLLIGILLSRTVSGIVGQYSGSWRVSYGFAATVTASLYILIPPFLPHRPMSGRLHYGRLLLSLLPLLRHPALLVSMSMNFLVFGAFSALWSTLTFHLATSPFGLGPAAAGLFGLWGAPGALLAPYAGRLSDQWGSNTVNAIAFVSMLSCFTIAGTIGLTSIAAIVVAVNLLDFGVQSGQIANQTRIFAIGTDIRGRLNTIYMVSTFSGGAVGALAGSYAWSAAGWTGVCLLGGGLVGGAAIISGTWVLLGARHRA